MFVVRRRRRGVSNDEAPSRYNFGKAKRCANTFYWRGHVIDSANEIGVNYVTVRVNNVTLRGLNVVP